MENQGNPLILNSRIVGLDAMRAILALLGIFFHASLSYMILFPSMKIPWYTHSIHTNLAFNWLMLWIHSFRMPAFFLLSGLFSFLIYKRKKLSGLTRSRIKRIGIPFSIICFSPIVFLYAVEFFLPQSKQFISNHAVFNSLKELGAYWFLYYLFLLDLASLVLICLAKPFKKTLLNCSRKFNNKKSLRIIGLSSLLILPALLMLTASDWYIPIKISIIPNLRLLTYYGIFFLLGWYLPTQYQYLIVFAKRYWPHCMLLSLLTITINIFMLNHTITFEIPIDLASINNTLSTLSMLLGIIGFCMNRFQSQKPYIQYLANSSYWIYLSQIPVILFMEGMLSQVNLPLFEQYLLSVVATMAICLLSYQLFIKNKKIFRYIDGNCKKIPTTDACSKHLNINRVG